MDEPGLIGRPAELSAVEALLDRGGGAAALFIEGEAGIGKSTVWGLGVAAAMRTGWRVLTSRGSQTETAYSFAGLTDLFDLALDEVGPDLRPPAREALELALLRRSAAAAPLGEREVSAASLAMLRRLCADGPVLVALDDLQWVDHATVDALAFALRRLPAERVRVLAARRIAGPVAASVPDRSDLIRAAFAGDRIEALQVGALGGPAIARLLESRLGIALSAQDLAQLVERTNGNPFWALEIGAAINRHGSPDGELPVPRSLSTLVTGRLAALSPEVREVLLVSAALSTPSVELATTALTEIADNPDRTIDAALTAGVVQLSADRLRPAHPLLGSTALETLPPGMKRRLYRRLAAIVTDPERHARLVRLGATGEPDPDIAAALDAGAVAARSRGAVGAAAELAEQAATMTPETQTEDRARRLILAGELLFATGDAANARRCATAALAGSPGNAVRCEAGLLLCSIEYWADGAKAWIELAEEALRDAGDDVALRAQAHAVIADLGLDAVTVSRFHATKALELLAGRADADPRTVAQATIALQVTQLDMGEGLDDELLRQAAAAEARAPLPPVTDRIATARACWLKTLDDLDGSRAAVEAVIDVANAEGDEAALSNLLMNISLIELWAGRYPVAVKAAEDAIRIGLEINILADTAYSVRGQLAAYTGDFDWARKQLPARLAITADAGNHRGMAHCLAAIGAGELLQGDAVAAAGTLRRALATLLALDVREPGRRLRLESDLGQALIAAGELDEAAALVTELRTFGPRSSAPTNRGIALRIEGMLEGARGNLDRATALLEEAAHAHEQSPIPLERARTQLALGQVLRRRRAKARARRTLQSALECFSALGATPFSDLAREELATISGASRGATLTAAEHRVAELVASGLSNKDIAARLFVSVRTIDSQLSSIYQKLGVRSRGELASQLAQPT